ncbi:hypothetical protein Rleg4DRAFT_1795 [Rhizobium leguminosarum bv. trifolii WSM2297]|uniref:Uncharacterized protein n=1 Tax=Rhizobium leguminosarum bv. trifolii WSM2297 TaxID=754762 RepID=J0W383_RHILT|nr:hypothetical protein Rleg4DRAFT_1795 [Rhizobium leguminosarum bv. trifolii WSM2297]
MRREVTVGETMPHPSTPRVIAHDTHQNLDSEVPLYAVFEFTGGTTLQAHFEERLVPM